MKKKLFIFLCLCFLILGKSEISASIGSIDSISNPEMRFNYDRYWGTILSYENRLIVSNLQKIEEFLILPDGDLQRIGFFEKNDNTRKSFIDGDRYYFLDAISNSISYPRITGLFIFDLSQVPMQFLARVEFETPLSGDSETNHLYFSDEFVMVSDYAGQRTILINKETFQIDGYINGHYGEYINRIGNKIIQPFMGPDFVRMRAFEIDENDVLTELSYIDLHGFDTAIYDILLDYPLVTLVLGRNIVVLDYSDFENPFIFSSVRNLNLGQTVAHLKDNKLFIVDVMRLLVYEFDDKGNFNLVCIKEDAGFVQRRNLHYVEPYLYINAEINLRVFDASQDYDLVNAHGSRMVILPGLSFSDNDIYYIEIDVFNGEQRIYAVLDNTLIATLNYDYADPHTGENFKVMGDRLYFSRVESGTHYFDIYQLNENAECRMQKSPPFPPRSYFTGGADRNIENVVWRNATLIKRITVANRAGGGLIMSGNRVFFSYSSPEEVFAYTLINDELIPAGSFTGSMDWTFTSDPQDYILNTFNTKLYVRDINNVSNVLFEGAFNLGNAGVMQHSYGKFLRFSHVLSSGQVYSFEMGGDAVNLFATISDGQINSFNNIITQNGRVTHISEYFSILNDQLTKIGEESFPHRNVIYTYFFPERKKMVQVAQSGIWVYDIEYSVSDSDIVVLPIKNELLSNFPNPFNPETTIRFNVAVESIVSIDIYNIRGQRVKGLVDSFYERGSHTVVWDGKDDNGRELGSGVYLYRMVAGDVVETRRMVLLK